MQDKIWAGETKLPAGFWAMVDSSVAVRKELFEEGTITIRTSYEPTDWSKECSEKEFWDGLDPRGGVCPECFMHITAAGACSTDCKAAEHRTWRA